MATQECIIDKLLKKNANPTLHKMRIEATLCSELESKSSVVYSMLSLAKICFRILSQQMNVCMNLIYLHPLA